MFGEFGEFKDFVRAHELAGFDFGMVVGALRAIGAVFAATARFDAEELAELDFVVVPMFEINFTPLFDEVEKRLMVDFA